MVKKCLFLYVAFIEKMIHDMIILLAETIIIDPIDCSKDQNHYENQ